ncbi:hypothetical protein CY0110_19947 [Crocosphaera chwakensis CCY0110]|uniref:Uncharacterized protein n=1 Tax=Crocosphaera chwakensis CCY0110 TaxID=391612 RepID=A3IJX1_9CHRO|nr:hypothetical protein CY0110_19947 [Crocosphaera chwakensis CCY0110]
MIFESFSPNNFLAASCYSKTLGGSFARF